jgi:hypothetical protein
VIAPTNVGGFLQLSHTQMTSLVTLTLRSSDDPVLADARADVRRHPLRSAVLLELIARSLAGRDRPPTVHSLMTSPWLQAVSACTPWISAYDGQPRVTPPPEDDSPEQLPEPALEGTAPDWSEVDMWAPPLEALAGLLRARPRGDFASMRDRLGDRLPNALDALVASDDLAMRSDDTVQVEPGSHPALFALASEATVRFGLSAEELRQYLVDVLLPPGVAD